MDGHRDTKAGEPLFSNFSHRVFVWSLTRVMIYAARTQITPIFNHSNYLGYLHEL
jgi:hypothetical protein